MQNNKILKYVGGLVILGIIFLLGVSVGAEKIGRKTFEGAGAEKNREKTETASIMIDYGNGKVETYRDIPVSGEENVFELLKTVAEKNKLALEYKDYGGSMGIFIETIGGVGKDSSGKKWWQYWVNNKYSEVGASGYKAQPNDVIEFKFISGQL